MSVFISYNYATSFKVAQAVAAQLESYGIDVWWLPTPLPLNQVDTIVEQALAVCQRCIVIQSSDEMSGWQQAEIYSIQNRLNSRRPPADTVDFFAVLRVPREDGAMPEKSIPLLQCSEYIDCYAINEAIPELESLRNSIPGIFALKYGYGMRPFFHTRSKNDCIRGKWSFTGGFKRIDSNDVERYCWLLLEDSGRKWYVQHPRPTVTHSKRWISSSVNIGPNIKSAVLIAVSIHTHQQLIAEVLSSQWGALYPVNLEGKKVLCRQSKKHVHELNCILGEVEIIDRLDFDKLKD